MSWPRGSVMSYLSPGEVAHHLIHAVNADGGEVVVEVAQVAARVGEESAVHVVLDGRALLFQGVGRKVDEVVEPQR